MSRPHSLTEGNILTSLMGFALPVLAALFLQTMYGAVDMMIVGQFSHAAEVSAVSTGSWIMQTITTAIVGLAMGTTILLGRKIGEGQPEEAGRVMGASIWIFAVIGLAVTAVMQFLAVPCTAWMRAPKEAFDGVRENLFRGLAVYRGLQSAGKHIQGTGKFQASPHIRVHCLPGEYRRGPVVGWGIPHGFCGSSHSHGVCPGGQRGAVNPDYQKTEAPLCFSQGERSL
jgi:hypothetical protein